LDGFTAAWVVHQQFGDKDTQYITANYGDSPPGVKGHDVVIVDFSFRRDVMLALAEEANSIVVLDHHVTAEAALKGLDFAHFDMERSGAGLAWDHFFPGKRRPWLVDYVEDRDLWRFKLPGSKEINAWIGAHPRKTFYDWDHLCDSGSVAAATKGEAVMRHIETYVEQMSAQARNVEFMGYTVPTVNAPFFLISELVGHLAQTAPFAIGWFQAASGDYQYSLRSRADFDVSEIAKVFGGGGHKQAAGFRIPTRVEDDARFRP
jgi:nanoRNase/pAp phosphatase (c-di-AMP/oligoRNAs hydrolase)